MFYDHGAEYISTVTDEDWSEFLLLFSNWPFHFIFKFQIDIKLPLVAQVLKFKISN